MGIWTIVLTVVATIAAVGQFVVAFRVYALQRSNERIARRVELMARIEQSDLASTLTISNLSVSFGVWIDEVTVRVRDESTGTLVTKAVRFDVIVPGSGYVDRIVFGLPRVFAPWDFGITLRARGKQSIAVANAGGSASFDDSPEHIFERVTTMLDKFKEIASYSSEDRRDG